MAIPLVVPIRVLGVGFVAEIVGAQTPGRGLTGAGRAARIFDIAAV